MISKLSKISILLSFLFISLLSHAAVTSNKCRHDYEDFIQNQIQGDFWLKMQIKFLQAMPEIFSGTPAGPAAGMGYAAILAAVINIPLLPIALPVEGIHDLFIKIRRAIYKNKYHGIMQTYALQENLFPLAVPFWMNPPYTEGSGLDAYYNTLISSEPFLILASARNVTSAEYPAFVAKLIQAYRFGPEFCGTGSDSQFIPLLEINL